ncbi:DUF2142 domain-containing protein [Leucobacter massiliensis]|uniref:DUF2142 domain-containing protein n=1 Tax=Leucobacter massiliensis TaxID=1686285 RepID=A0A2S9QKV6_9MICO|nr:DUF2142 domain-containing protein [Leucobacter massiliensis]PRI10213.1 hypothetical protein B4915_12440 [Leucobacter massiliensis]
MSAGNAPMGGGEDVKETVVRDTARAAAEPGVSGRRTALFAVLAGLLLMLTFGAWALSSPVGASPDEDFHIASIWCGSGEREGLCGAGSSADTRMVPDTIERAICYAHEPSRSAACQGGDFLDGRFGLTESDRVNGDGLYPSGYYFWTSLLASDNLVLSVLAMRFAQALLFSVLAVGLWLLLPRANRLAYAGGIVATFVPFGLFLIPSINPSGWAIASAALLLPALLGFFASEGRRAWALGGYAALAALLGLGARGDSAAYTVIAVLAALALSWEHSRRFWLRAIIPFGVIVAAAVAFLSANQTGSALGGGMAIDGAAEVPKRALLVGNLFDLPELFFGVLGQNFDDSPYTGLGWLDTPLPALVWLPTTFVFSAVLFTALAHFDWRKTVAVLGVASATVAIPLLLLVQNGVRVGWQVQPRYIMPLIIMLVIVALAPSRGPGGEWRRPGFSPAQCWTAAALLTVANSVALYTNLRRYVAPAEPRLGASVDWWWRSAPPPEFVWFAGSVAFAALAVLLVLLAHPGLRLRRTGTHHLS